MIQITGLLVNANISMISLLMAMYCLKQPYAATMGLLPLFASFNIALGVLPNCILTYFLLKNHD